MENNDVSMLPYHSSMNLFEFNEFKNPLEKRAGTISYKKTTGPKSHVDASFQGACAAFHTLLATDLLLSMNFSTYPWNIPDPQPTVYEGIPFIWGFRDSWGMLQGYVGVFLDVVVD